MEHTFLSPAKVNLFLKVVSRRPDGYHNLVSLVDPISLYDVLHVEEDLAGRVITEDDCKLLPQGPANTIYRAIMALKERYGVKRGVRVMVEKRIPIGAGLGGPSSNAAVVIREMSRLWGLQTSIEDLVALGKLVGADVPLFLYGKTCIMRGIGDRITPAQVPFLWYVIVYPRFVLHTKEVYEGLKIVLTRSENDINLSDTFSSVSDIADLLENDLEQVAFRQCPGIKSIKERLLQAGALGSLMSGSGSSVFGVFENEGGAREALQKVRDLGSVFIAHSLEEEGKDGDYRSQDLPR
ncbi:MAG TPA: 4-(cytidine 5'-diphospho)-2-C-methyl-D-erythritol kinase [Deltaproteobacteria bacterium]|nr:4-(cytidine 5'-diphospho)-2-C-methyl-D-erythritol kinase [Deltaproteobacteria bacterium]